MKRPSWYAWLVMAPLLAVVSFPLYWALISSFTPESRLFGSPSLVPRELILDHYRSLFDQRHFWRPIRNSLIVAGSTTIVSVVLGACCAYALARLRFRGRSVALANGSPGMVTIESRATPRNP